MSSKNADEDVDIYDDLPDFNLEESIQKLEAENKVLSQKVKDLSARVVELETQNNELNRKNRNLKANISALVKTVQLEIQRKDSTIAELRQEREDLFFRRKKPNTRGSRVQPSERNQVIDQQDDGNENSDRNKDEEEVLNTKRSTRQNALLSDALLSKRNPDQVLPTGRPSETVNHLDSNSKSSSPVPEGIVQTQSRTVTQLSSQSTEEPRNISDDTSPKSSRSSRSRKSEQENSEPAKVPAVYRLVPQPLKDLDEFQVKRSRRISPIVLQKSMKSGAPGEVSEEANRTEPRSASSVLSAKLKKLLQETQRIPTTPEGTQAKEDTQTTPNSVSPKKRTRKTPTTRLYVKTRSSPRLSAKRQNSMQESSNDGGTDISLLEVLQLEEKSQTEFTNSPMPDKLSPLRDNDKSLSPVPLLPTSTFVSPTPIPSSTPISGINSLLTGLLKVKQSPGSSTEPAELTPPLPERRSPFSVPKDPRKLPGSAQSSDKARKEVLHLEVLSYKEDTSPEEEPPSKESVPCQEDVSREGEVSNKEERLLTDTVSNEGEIPRKEEIVHVGETNGKTETVHTDELSRREGRKRDEGTSRQVGMSRREEERRGPSLQERTFRRAEKRDDTSRQEEISQREEKRRDDTSRQEQEGTCRREEKRREEESLRKKGVFHKEETKREGETARTEDMPRKEEVTHEEDILRKEAVPRKEDTESKEETSRKEEMSRREDITRKEGLSSSSSKNVVSSVPEIRGPQKQSNSTPSANLIDKNGDLPLKRNTPVTSLSLETGTQKIDGSDPNKQYSDSSALQFDFKVRRRTRVQIKMIINTPPGTPNNKSVCEVTNKVILQSPLGVPKKTVNEVVSNVPSTNRAADNTAKEIPIQKPVTQVVSSVIQKPVCDMPQATNGVCNKVRDKIPRDCYFNEAAHRDRTKHFNTPNRTTASAIRSRSRSRSPRSNLRENLLPVRSDYSHHRSSKGPRSPPPRHRHSRRDELRIESHNRRSRSLSPRFHLPRRNPKKEERQLVKLPPDKKEREMMLFGKSPDRNSPTHSDPLRRPVVVTVNVRRRNNVKLEDSKESKTAPPPPSTEPASLSSTNRLVATPIDFRERYAEVFSNTGESSDSGSEAFSSEAESSQSKDSDDSYRPKKKRKGARPEKLKPKSKRQRTEDR